MKKQVKTKYKFKNQKTKFSWTVRIESNVGYILALINVVAEIGVKKILMQMR